MTQSNSILKEALKKIAAIVAEADDLYCGEFYCPWSCGCDAKVYTRIEEVIHEVLGDEVPYEWTKKKTVVCATGHRTSPLCSKGKGCKNLVKEQVREDCDHT